MKTFNFPVQLLFFSSFLFSNHLFAQTIYIQIQDTFNKPISHALVKIDEQKLTKVADDNGIVVFDLNIGSHILDVEAGSTQHFHHYIEVKENTVYTKENLLLVSMISEPEHKIIIHANPIEHTSLDMATPITVISGDELISKRATTLGEILQLEPGLSFSSFGPAIARPVIRGLSGSRVTITNNQMTIQDASTSSADHDVGVEPLLVDQIEVVKGPASLLYGSGAIGGVVNTIDNKIQKDPIDNITGGFELRLADATTGERASVLTLNTGVENWNFHLDGFSSQSDDLTVPVSAESVQQLTLNGEDITGVNADSVLANSFSKTNGASLASTYLLNSSGEYLGHIGLSVSYIEKEYGLPGHEEHDEDEESAQPKSVINNDESVNIEMKQSVYHIQSEFENPTEGIDLLFVGYAYTDYQHQEIEGLFLGTEFINKASELKSYAKHNRYDGWEGVFGTQIIQRDFSAIGEEAFVPASLTSSKALFWLEEKHFGLFKWELGLRAESQSIHLDTGGKRSENGFSYSIGSIYDIEKHNKLAFNYSHAVRFANVAEYFSYGAHLASRTFEIGNPNLKQESSDNWDLSYRFENKNLTGEINIFYNKFSDYIFADRVTLSNSCLNSDAISDAQAESLSLICYNQKDAQFYGAELQLSLPIAKWGKHDLSLELFADYLNAKFKKNDYIPRIPTGKQGGSLHYNYQQLSTNLTWVHHSEQKKLAQNELMTKGFKMLDLDISYRVSNKAGEWFIFLKGKNLLDEEARDHGSFIKDLAPRVGRTWLTGMRYTF